MASKMGMGSDPRDTVSSWPLEEIRSESRHTPSDEFEYDDSVGRPLFQRVYWMREPHLRKLYGLSVILMIASVTTGYDGMLLNISQHINAWTWYFFPELKENPKLEDPVLDSKLAIMVNMFNIGSVISFFITPFIADTYGRRACIMIGTCILMTGGFLTAFCNGYGMYMGGRFLLGFGNSLSQMASPLLLTEICHPQHRGVVTAIYNCLWNAGALLVSCFALGTINITTDYSWRVITFLQVIPSFIQFCGIWFIPESPRYLINKDRHEEALRTLAKWHAGGDVNNATVQFEFREMKETIRIQKEIDQGTKFLDFVRTKGNRWRLAIIISLGVISQYSGNALFSNYMNVVYQGAGLKDDQERQKLAMTAGKITLDLIVTITAALNVDRFGRRPLFLVSTCGMVISMACWTVSGAMFEMTDEKSMVWGYIQFGFIWLFGIFYDIGFSGLLVAYALEVLPFHLRAKGMMIMNITVQAVLALGNQTNKIAWENLPNHWNFMLFYTIWDTLQLVFVYFVYVETKGPTLEEVARIFDGEGAVAKIDMKQVEKEVFHNQEHEEYLRRRRRPDAPRAL